MSIQRSEPMLVLTGWLSARPSPCPPSWACRPYNCAHPKAARSVDPQPTTSSVARLNSRLRGTNARECHDRARRGRAPNLAHRTKACAERVTEPGIVNARDTLRTEMRGQRAWSRW
jgi:hypothetical protein